MSKKYRGITKEDIERIFISYGFEFVPLECVKQCEKALVPFRVDEEICYICNSVIAPHQRDETRFGSKKSELFKTYDKIKTYCRPECEHIIPCNSGHIAPFSLMLMIGLNHSGYFNGDFTGISDRPIDFNSDNIIDLIKNYTASSHAEYFFNLIIRINYSWAHSHCNNIKTNRDFIKFNGNSYFIDKTEVTKYVSDFFIKQNPDTNWEILKDGFDKSALKKKGIYTDSINKSDESNDSIISRLEYIIPVLNDKEYEAHILGAVDYLTDLTNATDLSELTDPTALTGGCRKSKKNTEEDIKIYMNYYYY